MEKVPEQKLILVAVIMPSLGHLIYTTNKTISKPVLDVQQDLHCCQVLCLPVLFWGKYLNTFCHGTFFVWKHLCAHTQNRTLLFSSKYLPETLIFCDTW